METKMAAVTEMVQTTAVSRAAFVGVSCKRAS